MKLFKIALTPPIAVISVAIFAALGLRADVLQVGPDKAYKTIQAAVDAANTAGGDVIEVDEGTYTSDNTTTYFIDIEKPVTVKAVGEPDMGAYEFPVGTLILVK